MCFPLYEYVMTEARIGYCETVVPKWFTIMHLLYITQEIAVLHVVSRETFSHCNCTTTESG
jgi:hypothetical protein